MSSVVSSQLALGFVYLVIPLLTIPKAWSVQRQRFQINSEVDSTRCVYSKPGMCSNRRNILIRLGARVNSSLFFMVYVTKQSKTFEGI